jgi:hypothetical protein
VAGVRRRDNFNRARVGESQMPEAENISVQPVFDHSETSADMGSRTLAEAVTSLLSIVPLLAQVKSHHQPSRLA